MKRLDKHLDLRLGVSIWRQYKDLFFKGRVSGILGVSRSRLGLKTKRLGLEAQGLVYIPVNTMHTL